MKARLEKGVCTEVEDVENVLMLLYCIQIHRTAITGIVSFDLASILQDRLGPFQKRLSHSNVTDAVLGCSHCRHSVRDGLSGMSADSHLDYRHKASWPAHQTSSKLCRRQSGKDHYLCISHSRHQTAAHSVTRCHIL